MCMLQQKSLTPIHEPVIYYKTLSPPQRFKHSLYQSAMRSVPQAQSRMDRSGGEPEAPALSAVACNSVPALTLLSGSIPPIPLRSREHKTHSTWLIWIHWTVNFTLGLVCSIWGWRYKRKIPLSSFFFFILYFSCAKYSFSLTKSQEVSNCLEKLTKSWKTISKFNHEETNKYMYMYSAYQFESHNLYQRRHCLILSLRLSNSYWLVILKNKPRHIFSWCMIIWSILILSGSLCKEKLVAWIISEI